MIERLEPKEVEGTDILYDFDGTVIDIVKSGQMFTAQPSFKEIVDKINEIVDKLNKEEKEMETPAAKQESERKSVRILMSEYMRSMRENLEKQGIHLKDIKVKLCMGVPEDYILIEWEEENPVDTLARVAREVANE